MIITSSIAYHLIGANTTQYEPSWGYLDELVLNDLQVAMALDCLQSSHQISVPVNRPEEINQLFDTISYSKGTR